MDSALLRYVVMPLLAISVAVGLASMRLLQRYAAKAGYAFKTRLARIFLVANGLASMLLYLCLDASGIALLARPLLNSILLVILSAGIPIGILSMARIKAQSAVGTPVVVTVIAWINGIIESEIDVFVAQEVTELAISIERTGIPLELLQRIGNHLIQQRFSAGGKRKNIELAKMDDFVRDGNTAALICHLMQYCQPEWLAEQANNTLEFDVSVGGRKNG